MNECICEAIDFDDNCERQMSHTQASTSTTPSVTATLCRKEIVKALVERTQKLNGPRRDMDQQIATCGIYGGNHTTSQYAPNNIEPPNAKPKVFCFPIM